MTTSVSVADRSLGRAARALNDAGASLYRHLGHRTVDGVFSAGQAEAVIAYDDGLKRIT